MSTNEDKREFEFIEHPVSPNKHNSSRSSSTIVKMWVLLEGTQDPIRFNADITKITDLHDFKRVLKNDEDFKEELKNAKLQNIELLNNDNTPISPDTKLQTVANNTVKTPLVVRYPISSANLKISYKFGNHKLYECELPHNSGSFNLLKEAVIGKYSELETGKFYFTCEVVRGVVRQIENEYNFNTLISECELDGNSCVITLKVVEKDKKPFASWSFKEVFSKILRNRYTSLEDLPYLDMNTFAPLEREFDEEELKDFVRELHKYLKALNKAISTNETTGRTYINVFLATAVNHVKDVKNKQFLQLCMEYSLDGTYGVGPLDYVVKLGPILILIIEAKTEDMKQGAAQAIVQAYTLLEKLLRDYEEPTTYGIVTTGKSWRIFRLTGSLKEPVVYITEEFNCTLDVDDVDMKNEKKVLKYIVQIIQTQVDAYSKDNERFSKRVKYE